MAVGVVADEGDDAYGGVECGEVREDGACAAEAVFFALEMEDGDGSFGAEAVGVAEDIAVEHDVADEEDIGGGEVGDEVDEAIGHLGYCSGRRGWGEPWEAGGEGVGRFSATVFCVPWAEISCVGNRRGDSIAGKDGWSTDLSIIREMSA